MWDFLIRVIDRIILLLGIKLYTDNKTYTSLLEDKLKVLDEIKSIKAANADLSRDDLINGVLKQPLDDDKPKP